MNRMTELAEAKNSVESLLSHRTKEIDENGRVIIHMVVNDDNDFLSVFSANETPIINESVADFIENSTASLPLKSRFTLRIHSNCIDDIEKTVYSNAIREYYFEKYAQKKQKIKSNRFIIGILAFLGVFVLGIALLLENYFNNLIWSEVADIAAWVLIWEAFDIGVFQNKGLKYKKTRYLSFINMKIEYYEKN